MQKLIHSVDSADYADYAASRIALNGRPTKEDHSYGFPLQ